MHTKNHKIIISALAALTVLALIVCVVPTTQAADANVCQIGSTNYTTINGAINSMSNGSSATIKLLADTDSDSITMFNKKITFDLNGHTLNIKNTDGTKETLYSLMIYNNGEININGDGALNITSTKGGIMAWLGAKVSVSNVTVATTSVSSTLAISASDDATINISGNVSFTGVDGFAVIGNKNSVITIGGSVTATNEGLYLDGVHATDDAVVTVGKVTVNGEGVGVTATKNAIVTVNGDIFTDTSNGILAQGSATVTVNGNINAGSNGIYLMNSTKVTVNGKISAGTGYKDISFVGTSTVLQATSSKPGYLEYSDPDHEAIVWVKDIRPLESIAVTTLMTKNVYVEGDTLDLTGLVVTATYEGGSSSAVAGYTTSPANGDALNTIGTVTVTVSYTQDGVMKTTSFNINVSAAPVLKSIAVTTMPDKVTYYVGDTLDLIGLAITAAYDEGSPVTVTGYTANPADGDALDTIGTVTVTVSYTERGVTKTATFDVTVESLPVLESIEVTTMPAKTEYAAGEPLDLTGLVITAAYDKGSPAAVTGYTTDPASGTALLTQGDQTIEVSYTAGGVTETTSFTVSVGPAVFASIAVTTMPAKTVYTEGDTLDLTGLVITMIYTDESTIVVTDYTVNPADGGVLDKAGTVTINVSYTEGEVTKTTSFTVKVDAVKGDSNLMLIAIAVGVIAVILVAAYFLVLKK